MVITKAGEPAGRAHAHAAGGVGGRGKEGHGRAARSAPHPGPFGSVSAACWLLISTACFAAPSGSACAAMEGCGSHGRLPRAPARAGRLPVRLHPAKHGFSDPLCQGCSYSRGTDKSSSPFPAHISSIYSFLCSIHVPMPLIFLTSFVQIDSPACGSL